MSSQLPGCQSVENLLKEMVAIAESILKKDLDGNGREASEDTENGGGGDGCEGGGGGGGVEKESGEPADQAVVRPVVSILRTRLMANRPSRQTNGTATVNGTEEELFGCKGDVVGRKGPYNLRRKRK